MLEIENFITKKKLPERIKKIKEQHKEKMKKLDEEAKKLTKEQ